MTHEMESGVGNLSQSGVTVSASPPANRPTGEQQQ